MRVTIKTWQELLSTEGVVKESMGITHTPTNTVFVGLMKTLCGKQIEVIVNDGLKLKQYQYLHRDFPAYIAEWMIKSKSDNFNSLYEKLTNA